MILTFRVGSSQNLKVERLAYLFNLFFAIKRKVMGHLTGMISRFKCAYVYLERF